MIQEFGARLRWLKFHSLLLHSEHTCSQTVYLQPFTFLKVTLPSAHYEWIGVIDILSGSIQLFLSRNVNSYEDTIYDKIREDSERKWNVRFSFTLFNSSNQLLLLILKAIFFLAYLWHKEEMCFSSDMSFWKHQDNFCLPCFL